MTYKNSSMYVSISSDRKQSSSAKWIMLISLVLLLPVTGALGKVFIDQQTKDLRRERELKYKYFSVIKKRTENLKLQLETYRSGDYILTEAKKLGLISPIPGQVITMKTKDTEDKKSLLAAK